MPAANEFGIQVAIDASGASDGAREYVRGASDVADAAQQASDANRDLKKSLDELGDSSVKDALDNIQKSLGFLNAALGAIGVTGLALEFRQLIEAGKQLEDEFIHLQIASSASNDQLVQFKASARALSDEFGQSQIGVVAAQLEAARSGFRDVGDNALVTTAAIKLSQVSFTDLGTATSTLTRIMQAYHLDADQAQNVSESLFVTARQGKIDIGELGTIFGRLAPSVAAAGVSINDVLSVMSALGQSGENARMTMMGLRGMLDAIGHPTQDARMAFEDLAGSLQKMGISATTMKDLVAEKGLAGALQVLNEAVGGSQIALNKLFGSAPAGNTAFLLLHTAAASLAQVQDDLKNKQISFADAFDKVTASLSNQANVLKANVQNAFLDLADKGLNVLRPVIEELNEHFGLLEIAVGLVAAAITGRLIVSLIAAISAYAQNVIYAAQMEAGLQALAAGTMEVSTAEIAMAGTTEMLSGAMAVLGGPVGIIFIAIGAIVAWIMHVQNASQATDDLNNHVLMLAGAYKQLNEQDVAKSLSAEESNIAKIKKEIENVESQMQRLENRPGKQDLYDSWKAQLISLESQLKQSTAAVDALKRKGEETGVINFRPEAMPSQLGGYQSQSQQQENPFQGASMGQLPTSLGQPSGGARSASAGSPFDATTKAQDSGSSDVSMDTARAAAIKSVTDEINKQNQLMQLRKDLMSGNIQDEETQSLSDAGRVQLLASVNAQIAAGTKGLDANSDAFKKLLGSLDPVVAATNKYTDTIRDLDAYSSEGVVTLTAHARAMALANDELTRGRIAAEAKKATDVATSDLEKEQIKIGAEHAAQLVNMNRAIADGSKTDADRTKLLSVQALETQTATDKLLDLSEAAKKASEQGDIYVKTMRDAQDQVASGLISQTQYIATLDIETESLKAAVRAADEQRAALEKIIDKYDSAAKAGKGYQDALAKISDSAKDRPDLVGGAATAATAVSTGGQKEAIDRTAKTGLETDTTGQSAVIKLIQEQQKALADLGPEILKDSNLSKQWTEILNQQAMALQLAKDKTLQLPDSIKMVTIAQDEYAIAVDLATQQRKANLISEDEYQAQLVNLKGILDKSSAQYNEWAAIATGAGKAISTAFTQFLFNPFQEGLKGMVASFLKSMEQIIAQAESNAILKALFSSMASGGTGTLLGGLGADMLTAVPHAAGGAFSANQTLLVGEQGPEIVRFGTSGTVVPNDQMLTTRATALAQSSGGGDVTVNMPIDARGATSDAIAMMPMVMKQASDNAVARVVDMKRRGRL
jgi:TP901 family phage tail tape measure protein